MGEGTASVKAHPCLWLGPLPGRGCRERGVQPHLSHRMQNTLSSPLASSTRLKTPQTSGAVVGQTPGGSAPAAAWCPASGPHGAPQQLEAPAWASLGRREVRPGHRHPLGLSLLFPPAWSPVSYQPRAGDWQALRWGSRWWEGVMR